MADGFLGRWSQRKQAVREGKPLQEPVLPVAERGAEAAALQPKKTSASNQVSGVAATVADAQRVGQGADAAAPAAPVEQAPPLTLQDAAALSADSDYAPFAARSVAPEVRNAAMKKLFTNPHYNVMDRLDTYIDDYSLPDPLPESMLRQMASAKFLKLFDEEPEAAPTSAPLPSAALPKEPQRAPQSELPGLLQQEPDAMPQPEPAPPVSVAIESHPEGAAPDTALANGHPSDGTQR